jgi:hypothetical protein
VRSEVYSVTISAKVESFPAEETADEAEAGLEHIE